MKKSRKAEEYSTEQKSYLESVKSLFTGYNSYMRLAYKVRDHKKKVLFPETLEFTNKGIQNTKVFGNYYLHRVIDKFDLDFLEGIDSEQKLYNVYKNLSEFFDLYFNHLRLVRKEQKYYNINFRYQLTVEHFNGLDEISKAYKINSPRLLSFAVPEDCTFYKWKSEANKFKNENNRVFAIVNKINFNEKLTQELLKIFLELAYIYKFHRKYYLDLLRALRVIFDYETARVYLLKEQEEALVIVANNWKCKPESIAKILKRYRVNSLRGYIYVPQTWKLINQFNLVKKNNPKCFRRYKISAPIIDKNIKLP